MNIVLTIAGSDSGGGAGIQADLKTFSALCVFGTSAITAVTAQNTEGVYDIVELPPASVAAQIDAVLSDFDVRAAKTGMLSSAPIIGAVAARVRHWNLVDLVVDPVMVAKGGDRLLREDAVTALRDELLPLALIVTPNIPEAEVLADMRVRSEFDREEAARRIGDLGPRWVVVKGGHLQGDPVDLVWDGENFHRLPGVRIASTSTHGTGCTFSAAIAAGLAAGRDPEAAIAGAKEFVIAAIRYAPGLGRGHGPLNHQYAHCGGEDVGR